MSVATPEHDQASARTYVPEYTAVVVDDTAVVLDERFATAAERRDAVVALLIANHDEVPTAQVEEILADDTDENIDETLSEIASLYADFDVDVYLGTHRRDVGPTTLFTAFTDYGNGETFIEHYGSRDERLAQLRDRAAHAGPEYPDEFFQNADEETCRRIIETALSPTKGTVLLLEAVRHVAHQDVYTGAGA